MSVEVKPSVVFSFFFFEGKKVPQEGFAEELAFNLTA